MFLYVLPLIHLVELVYIDNIKNTQADLCTSSFMWRKVAGSHEYDVCMVWRVYL